MKPESRSRKFSFQATEEIIFILEKSKNESDQSIDQLPGLYVVMDQSGHIFRANKNFLALVSQERDSKKHPQFFDYLNEIDKESLIQQLRLAHRHLGVNFKIEVSLSFSRQTVDFSISLYCWTIKRSSEDLILFTLVGRDVSELKKVSLLKDRLQKELISAEQLQNIMLPVKSIQHNKIEISCYYRAAAECGGDFLHYTFNDDHVLIWAGDVSGHGLGPAMVTGAVRGAVSVLERQDKVDLLQWMTDLNRTIREISKSEYWMTFQIIEFDFKKQVLKVCQAGHTPVYKLDIRGIVKKSHWRDFTTVLPETSHVLGATHHPKIHYYEEKLQKDCLYLSFSDGFIEATNNEMRQFGLRKIFQSISESMNKGKNLEQVKDQLIFDVQAFTDHQPLKDDLSIWSFILHE